MTFELEGRLQSLVRARELSRTLLDKQERLKVLHRVLRHNMRNSLNVVMGRAQLIDDTAENEHVNQIMETTRRLLHHADNARSIDNILEDASGTEIELTPVLGRCVESHRAEYPRADIALSIEDSMRVSAIDGFPQVVDELVQNAITHNPDDHPAVSVSATKESNHAVLSVSDTGPPLPDPDQAILEQGLNPASLEHGSGLGLWLVAWTVRRSNGVVEYSRELDGNHISIKLLLVESPPTP